MGVGAALEALGRALDGAGVERWRAPASLAEVTEVEARIAPLRLPAAVREFWSQVDPRTLRVSAYPRFITPAFALEGWEEVWAAYSSLQPVALLQIGYESHETLSVELCVDDAPGGALFEGFVSDPAAGFTRRFNDLADWLNHVAAMVSGGRFAVHEDAHGAHLRVPGLQANSIVPLPSPDPHPVHGSVLRYGGTAPEWPAHWRRATALTGAPPPR